MATLALMRSRALSIANLKNNLSAYLAEVREGEEILVRDRNVSIAKITPLRAMADASAELAALAAQGKVRLPDAPLSPSIWRLKAPRVPQKKLLEALRAERDER
jgi:prevent-host-death family protein